MVSFNQSIEIQDKGNGPRFGICLLTTVSSIPFAKPFTYVEVTIVTIMLPFPDDRRPRVGPLFIDDVFYSSFLPDPPVATVPSPTIAAQIYPRSRSIISFLALGDILNPGSLGTGARSCNQAREHKIHSARRGEDTTLCLRI